MNKLFQVVILAGGIATRLCPISETIPKSLVKINDIPFIHHQLRLLQRQGIKKVLLCLGYLGDQIIDYVGDGTKYDLTITYAFDGPQLLGTAGAIKNNYHLLDDYFFVLYGDSYLLCDFSAIQNSFIQSQKLALMTVFYNQGKWDTSNVEFSHQTILAYDKKNRTERMQYIDYGLGIFNKTAFQNISDTEPYDLALLYQTILKNNELAAYEVKERFYEIGSFAGIEELNHLLKGIVA